MFREQWIKSSSRTEKENDSSRRRRRGNKDDLFLLCSLQFHLLVQKLSCSIKTNDKKASSRKKGFFRIHKVSQRDNEHTLLRLGN